MHRRPCVDGRLLLIDEIGEDAENRETDDVGQNGELDPPPRYRQRTSSHGMALAARTRIRSRLVSFRPSGDAKGLRRFHVRMRGTAKFAPTTAEPPETKVFETAKAPRCQEFGDSELSLTVARSLSSFPRPSPFRLLSGRGCTFMSDAKELYSWRLAVPFFPLRFKSPLMGKRFERLSTASSPFAGRRSKTRPARRRCRRGRAVGRRAQRPR